MLKNKKNKRNLKPKNNFAVGGFFYNLISSQHFYAVIALLILLVIIFPLVKIYSQRRLVEKEISDVQNQINNFERENKQLKELIAYLQSDQSLESQARLNLNLKKPGEGVIVVEQNNNKVNKKIASSAKDNSNFIKWWHYFFK